MARPTRAGEAANEILRVRLTTAERGRLDARAEREGRAPADLVRGWINDPGVPCHAPEDAAGPVTDAAARERASETVKLHSRWAPRHLWTLHVVPGRLEGPPLAVRRRVLRDEAGLVFETPGGDCYADDKALEFRGRVRTLGTAREQYEDTDPIGQAPSLDVFDHCPTAEERAAWFARHRREQVELTPMPQHVWVAVKGTRRRDRAERRAFRATDARYSIQVPGFEQRLDLRDLAIDGSASASAPTWCTVNGVFAGRMPTVPDIVRVWLHEPTAADLAATAVLRWTWLDQVAELERQAQAQDEARARAQQKANEEYTRRVADETRRVVEEVFGKWGRIDPGEAAMRELGLDPKGATVEEVQAAFRARAKAGHADHGGDEDMARLVELRDRAREYAEKRAA